MEPEGAETCATWEMRFGAWPGVRSLADGTCPVRRWDDLRLAGLKLIFLVVSRAVSLLSNQLAVAQRERPRAHSRLTWTDQAWLALLAGTLPLDRLAAMRLFVTPGTIVRWHLSIVGRR